jgi:hypothetical protein
LKVSVAEWIAICEMHGLRLRNRGNLFFVPARYALAFRELPAGLVDPLFRAGERLLHSWSGLDPLSDYKWLELEKDAAPTA